MLFGAIEGGGTRFRCALGDAAGVLHETHEVATSDPARTLAEVLEFFEGHSIEALGLACFGPLGLDPLLPNHGYMLATPKPGWAGCDLLGTLGSALGVPLALDTDVNGAALGEAWLGAGRGAGDVVYVTVGTGVGIGAMVNGKTLRGRMHSEAGHLRVRRLEGDGFEGVCPFHRDCLEGLISGPALAARTGRDPQDLSDDDPVWEPVVAALAEGLASVALMLAPQRMLLGGGVGLRAHLLQPLRDGLAARLAGYLPEDCFGPMERWLVPAGLGRNAGLVGALRLALNMGA
ncbi:MAG: fructokinase [Planctomycetota bacterium]|jgi:fructokinase